jgi:hypothetical protein
MSTAREDQLHLNERSVFEVRQDYDQALVDFWRARLSGAYYQDWNTGAGAPADEEAEEADEAEELVRRPVFELRRSTRVCRPVDYGPVLSYLPKPVDPEECSPVPLFRVPRASLQKYARIRRARAARRKARALKLKHKKKMLKLIELNRRVTKRLLGRK